MVGGSKETDSEQQQREEEGRDTQAASKNPKASAESSSSASEALADALDTDPDMRDLSQIWGGFAAVLARVGGWSPTVSPVFRLLAMAVGAPPLGNEERAGISVPLPNTSGLPDKYAKGGKSGNHTVAKWVFKDRTARRQRLVLAGLTRAASASSS